MNAEDSVKLARRFIELPLEKRRLFLAGLREEGVDFSLLPIPAEVAVDERDELSYAQRRMLFLWQLDPQGCAYNLPMAVRLKGALDEDALQRAFDSLVARHETLRTRFVEAHGQARQLTSAPAAVSIVRHDLTHLDVDGRQAQVRYLAQAEASAPFDLLQGPLLRVQLLELNDQEYVLLLTLHHIVADGWSMNVLIDEFVHLYDAASSNARTALPALAIQYRDYALWQRSWLQAGEQERQLDYWRAKLGDDHSPLELPLDHPRPSTPSYRGARHEFQVDPALTERLRKLAKEQGVTLFMVLLAAFKMLLARYSGQRAVRVGVPVANRNRSEVEGLIGCFINTQVLHTDIDPLIDIRECLLRVKDTALGAQAHQELPFERLVEAMAVDRSASHHPLFQVLFNHQAKVAHASRIRTRSGLQVEQLPLDKHSARFDLALDTYESAGQLQAVFTYALDVFDGRSVDAMGEHWLQLLEGLTSAPTQVIGALPLRGEPAQPRWSTDLAQSADLCIHQLIQQAGAKIPQRIAACSGEQSITYEELERQSNAVAQSLVQCGVRLDQRIGVVADRSIEMVIGIVAIMKAGAAYLPLEPEQPQARLEYILADSEVTLVLGKACWRQDLPQGVRLLALDAPLPQIGAQSIPWQVSCDNLAYVIYTSGTTGEPKGVGVSHRALVNYVSGVTARLPMDQIQNLAMVTTPAADLAHTVFYASLCTGKTVHLLDKQRVLDADAFAAYMDLHAIDLLKIVPSHLQAMLGAGRAALPKRCLVLGGEACTPGLLARIGELAPDLAVINHYGPTETTVGVLTQRLTGQQVLGRPLYNLYAMVLDAALHGVPGSARGELYVAGLGLARGYLGRPALTAERFVPDIDGNGERMYRTGDWVRHTALGDLQFIGRMDGQVKIRGHRIELAQIDSRLRALTGVADAVVRLTGDDDARHLTAYVVPSLPIEVPAQQAFLDTLRATLMLQLAEPMIPVHWLLLERLPVTVNGKLDVKALPPPTAAVAGYIEPVTTLQIQLAQIWAEVLRVERVGLSDDFFALGGHSLLATQVVSRARQQLKIEIPLRTLFDTPGLLAFAEAVQACTNPTDGGIARVDREQPLAVSHAQHRQWLFWKLNPQSTAYNTPLVVRLQGVLNREALQAALDSLVGRHETLRTVFYESDGLAWQRVLPATAVVIGVEDLTAVPATDLASRLEQEAFTPFDLEQGPLIRARLFKTEENLYLLAVTLHHIASDGWSMSLMVREFAGAYNARVTGQEQALEPLAVQYADYAAWQRRTLAQGLLTEQLDYWKLQLEDDFDVLQLPSDRLRAPVQSYRGGRVDVHLADDLAGRLRELALATNTTLFHVFLAAFAIVLSRYSAKTRINVGVPVTHRNRLELEALIGFFVNTVVARVDVQSADTFTRLIAAVKEITLQAQAHNDVPFDVLVEALRPERTLGHNPLFQVMYNHLRDVGEGVSAHSLLGLRVEEVELAEQTAQFDLLLTTLERADGITASFNYASDLFDRERIERMAGHWLSVLEEVAAQPERAVGEVPLLSAAERRLIIGEWGDTQRGARSEACIHQLFETQAAETPDATALMFADQILTYAQLNHRANRLAHKLQALGVGPDVLVGIAVERGLEMVVALLAILKAGGAYVPLDPQYPQDRIAYMLEDSQALVLLSQSSLLGGLPATFEARTVLLDQLCLEAFSDDNPISSVTPGNLAYSIYTSGSTGRPKGVLIEHHNAVAMIDWSLTVYDRQMLHGVLASTSICFDLSVWELFVTLSAGGSAVLAQNVLELPYLPARDQVGLINTVPSAIKALSDAGQLPRSVHTINLAGEPLKQSLVDTLYGIDHVHRVYDLYGPSEDTTYSTYTLRVADGQANIGRPISNTSAYLLDIAGQSIAVGGMGELCLSGSGLARGYLGRPSLTAEKFLPDPFDRSGRGGRLYRTGDLARYRPDGVIEYVGRIDHQVKVRGMRIELGEIESRLQRHPAVREAVVIDVDVGYGKQLVAYFVPADTAVANSTEQQVTLRNQLKDDLKRGLPDYMVPAWLVVLAQLPLTPNGKLDRKALPVPDVREHQQAYQAPRSELEQQISVIWAELLKVERVGLNDNFFELGGHSLLATQVVSQVNARLGIDMPLRLIFEFPLLSELTIALTNQGLSLSDDGLSDIEKLMNEMTEV